MKTLKFRQNLAEEILAGRKTATWRIFDDKDLQVGDRLEFIIWESKEKFAEAEILSICEKKLKDIEEKDYLGHEKFVNNEEMLNNYRNFYGEKVNWNTLVKMIDFKIL